MIKNGKFFVPVETKESDFKTLFRRLASAGAGRPVDRDGFPQGPWTPELLADAISQIDANHAGIELRTVQLWFQDNDKGISSDNIRWLARIFGCDDPEATSQWQAALGASQARLTARRRRRRVYPERTAPVPGDAEHASGSYKMDMIQPSTKPAERFDLARRSERIFTRKSPLDLPASVFAGAVALGLLSYFLGIHSVTYVRDDDVTKQAGFLWTPNWTLLFMVFMPLFFAFAVDLLTYWKDEGRSTLRTAIGGANGNGDWTQKIEASTYTFWAAFITCLGFAGLFQWISVRLIPLLQGGGEYATDWGSLAIEHPDIITAPQAIAFTGLAYLYMCLCYYLFFVGLILLYTLAHDFWQIECSLESQETIVDESFVADVRQKVIRGVFRCTVPGVMIAICMKLQSTYLATDAKNVIDWLAGDALSALLGYDDSGDLANFSTPTHYTSLLVAMLTLAVFLYAFQRLGLGRDIDASVWRMAAMITLMGITYLIIGAFSGFSILLGITCLLAVYGLFDPAFGARAPQ